MDNISRARQRRDGKGPGKWEFGIRIAASPPNQIGHVSVTGNSIRAQLPPVLPLMVPASSKHPCAHSTGLLMRCRTPLSGIGKLPGWQRNRRRCARAEAAQLRVPALDAS